MGIQGLLPFLSNIQRKVHVSKYAGQCVAVDTSCWLHRGAFSCAFELATGQSTTKYVGYIVKRINLLLHHKIYPVMVFDGCNAPSKKGTNEKRRETRQINREKGRKLLAEGNKSAAVDMFQKSISITTEMVQQVIKECIAMNVPIIVAPYEADAQLTYLVNSEIVDFAITEDSDLLPFGCKKVLFKMDEIGNAQEIDLADLGKTAEEPRFDGWSIDKFRRMCIMSGCDYLDRLPKCGLKTVHKQFRKYTNVDKGIKNFITNHNMKNVENINSQGYYDKFVKAEQAFKHHLIFNPETGTIQPLLPLPPHLQLTDLPFLGDVFNSDKAVLHANGNIDPQTGKELGAFPSNHRKLVKTCQHWRDTKGNVTAFIVQDSVRGKQANGSSFAQLTSKDTSTSKAESTLSTWSPLPPDSKPVKTSISSSTKTKRSANVPELVKMSTEEGRDDMIVKMYGSGKRRKTIPNTTEQKSCYFRSPAGTGSLLTNSQNSNNPFAKTDRIESTTCQIIKLEDTHQQDNDMIITDRDSRHLSSSPKPNLEVKNENPLRKINESKENIPLPLNEPPKKFESVLTRPSHIISSHSSAIDYEKSLSETIGEKAKSDTGLSKIPSPIKTNPVTCGLSLSKKSVFFKSEKEQCKSDLLSNVAEGGRNNKWISTQSKQKRGASGSITKPISIGLLPSKKKTQQTLNMFVKKCDDDQTSKYFASL